VAYQESIDLDEDAARILARLADGGMRDGLSLLDQCASATAGELTAQRVYDCLGVAGERRCGELMGFIAEHNTKGALKLFNDLYTEGKDLGAMLDELACLARDLLVLKTAGNAGIPMLSGVASDREVMELTRKLGSGELIRMIGLLQNTMAGFTRSASRRMDAELCILEMCQPELSQDLDALNARLTRLEEQLKSGSFVPIVSALAVTPAEEDDRPPLPDDCDAPPDPEAAVVPASDTPPGFWAELVSAARKELRPPASGFFVATPNSPVQGVIVGNVLELRCTNDFTAQTIDKPQIMEVLARKAGALLGRPVRAKVVDMSAAPKSNARMEQLLRFGRDHSDVIKIKNN